MALQFLFRCCVWPRDANVTDRNGTSRDLDARAFRISHKPKADLSTAPELDINLGEELGIKQRAVLDPLAAVDSEPNAQSIETVLCSRMPRARKRKGVDHPTEGQHWLAATFKFEIEKAEIEGCVVRDQRRVGDELEKFIDPFRKAWLVRQKDRAQAVDGLCFDRHLTFRIEIGVKVPASFNPVVDFNTPNLDHAIATRRTETRGFRIEDDFTH